MFYFLPATGAGKTGAGTGKTGYRKTLHTHRLPVAGSRYRLPVPETGQCVVGFTYLLSRGAKRLGGETSSGRTDKGAKRPSCPPIGTVARPYFVIITNLQVTSMTCKFEIMT